MLTEAYARNDLEQAEFERRVEHAQGAQTLEELETLVADFPAEARELYGTPAAEPLVLAPADLERRVVELDGESAPTRFSLIGDQHIRVLPTDPRVLRSVSIIGDAHVDLRALAGEKGVFLLKVATLIGDTKIMVPAGTRVETRAMTLIGDLTRGPKGHGLLHRIANRLGIAPLVPETRHTAPGPTVVVTGFKIIGDTQIVEG
jgi:hypothetical protein